jgi:hypothetical protein
MLVINENIQELRETQERLDLIRVEIISILEKKLKQEPLNQKEISALKTYYGLGEKLLNSNSY